MSQFSHKSNVNKSTIKVDSQLNMTTTDGFATNQAQDEGDIQDSIEPLQGFGDYESHEEKQFEGQCYLKTKTDRYKEHWAIITGNDLYCYRNPQDKEHRVMHSLIGTFIKDMEPEDSVSENCRLYPVKIVLPPNKSRILYFKSQEMQNKWLERLKTTVGYSNMFDYYNFEENLGKGQFGLVKLATHK